MPAELPYMNSSGNLPAIFDKVQKAGSPARFSHEFLRQLGFQSSNDRGVVKVLKELAFVDDAGVPLDRYHEYHHGERSRAVMAEGLRQGWGDILRVEPKPQDKGVAQLTGVFSRVTGKGEAVS